MPRNPTLLAAGVLLAFAPAAARAQDRTIAVVFEPCKEQMLNNAIAAALTEPPFVLQTRYTPGVLVISIPDRVTVEHGKVSGTVLTFAVAFSRDGGSLGQSVETCNDNKLSDCTDQLVKDVKSVAGMEQ
jgi:hypothetical protein